MGHRRRSQVDAAAPQAPCCAGPAWPWLRQSPALLCKLLQYNQQTWTYSVEMYNKLHRHVRRSGSNVHHTTTMNACGSQRAQPANAASLLGKALRAVVRLAPPLWPSHGHNRVVVQLGVAGVIVHLRGGDGDALFGTVVGPALARVLTWHGQSVPHRTICLHHMTPCATHLDVVQVD